MFFEQHRHIFKYEDVLSGTLAGAGMIASGYPLDTLKVRMQLDNNSLPKAFRALRSEGYSSFFTGINYPLKTLPFVNAVVFSCYEIYKRATHTQELSLSQGLTAGAFAGLCNSYIVGPVELIKCRMQVEPRFSNSRECLRHILHHEGPRGLFKGMFSTIMREVPAYAAQFGVYQHLKDYAMKCSGSEKMGTLETLLAGGFCGMACWVFSYPQDTIKTKLQVESRYKSTWFDGGFFDCAKQIYMENGLKGFFRGLMPCLAGAFVSHAIAFLIYQECQHISTGGH